MTESVTNYYCGCRTCCREETAVAEHEHSATTRYVWPCYEHVRHGRLDLALSKVLSRSLLCTHFFGSCLHRVRDLWRCTRVQSTTRYPILLFGHVNTLVPLTSTPHMHARPPHAAHIFIPRNTSSSTIQVLGQDNPAIPQRLRPSFVRAAIQMDQ
jgi:hypothetical protein